MRRRRPEGIKHVIESGRRAADGDYLGPHAQALAASLEPGETCTFSIGSLTKAALGAYEILGIQPEVY